MTDLIERLRAEEPMGVLSGCCDTVKLTNPDGPEAADQLEAQQAEIARLQEALTTLKGHCNKHIKSINQGAGIHTPSFAQINMLLKQCDEAFKALDQKP